MGIKTGRIAGRTEAEARVAGRTSAHVPTQKGLLHLHAMREHFINVMESEAMAVQEIEFAVLPSERSV